MPLRQAVRQARESNENQALTWGRMRPFSSFLAGFPETRRRAKSVYVSGTYWRIERGGGRAPACGGFASPRTGRETVSGAFSNLLIPLALMALPTHPTEPRRRSGTAGRSRGGKPSSPQASGLPETCLWSAASRELSSRLRGGGGGGGVSDHLRRSGTCSPLPEGEVGPSGPGEGLQPSPAPALPLTLAALDLSPPGRGEPAPCWSRSAPAPPPWPSPQGGRETCARSCTRSRSASPSGMTRVVGLSQSQRLRARSVSCEPSGEIEGGVQGSPARWVMVVSVRAELLVTGGSCQADLLRQRPRVGLPRPQVCEACGGTAPRPASATPRERAPHRTRMPVAIAELAAEVKNKVRTLLTASPHHGTARLENNVYATAQNGPVLKSGICTYCRSSLIRQVTLTEAVNSRVAGGTIWTV